MCLSMHEADTEGEKTAGQNIFCQSLHSISVPLLDFQARAISSSTSVRFAFIASHKLPIHDYKSSILIARVFLMEISHPSVQL